jgi:hypothetical protein
MNSALKRFFRQGAIRVPREKERAVYFYAMVVLFILYLLNLLHGAGLEK